MRTHRDRPLAAGPQPVAGALRADGVRSRSRRSAGRRRRRSGFEGRRWRELMGLSSRLEGHLDGRSRTGKRTSVGDYPTGEMRSRVRQVIAALLVVGGVACGVHRLIGGRGISGPADSTGFGRGTRGRAGGCPDRRARRRHRPSLRDAEQLRRDGDVSRRRPLPRRCSRWPPAWRLPPTRCGPRATCLSSGTATGRTTSRCRCMRRCPNPGWVSQAGAVRAQP